VRLDFFQICEVDDQNVYPHHRVRLQVLILILIHSKQHTSILLYRISVFLKVAEELLIHNKQHPMKLLYRISVFLQVAEELLFGIPLFLAPDLFFNADNGLVLLRPFRHTSLDSGHLDIATQISLAGAGASMLTFLICRLLVAETDTEKAFVSRMKIINDLMLFPVIIHSAFFEKSGFFDVHVFMMLANFKLFSIVLNLNSLRVPTAGQRTTDGYSMGARLILLYCLPVGILLYATPNLFAPGAVLSSFYTKTPLGKDAFDALETFAIRLEGSQLLGFLPLFWDATKMPHFAYKTCVIFMTFYLFIFMRGILDRSGYCDLEVWKGNFVLHLVVLSFAWSLSRTKFEDFTPFKTYPRILETKKQSVDGILPELKTEPLHEKVE
jgi:hypothetical protein